MTEKAFLQLAPNHVVADILLAELEEAGYPAIAVQGQYPYPHAGAPVEIWLLDGTTLEQPVARNEIEEILGRREGPALASSDEESPSKRFWFRWWHGLICCLALVALWLAGCGATPSPPFRFMKGGEPTPLSQSEQAWADNYRFQVHLSRIPVEFQTAISQARLELLPLGFVERSNQKQVAFWRYRGPRAEDTVEGVFLLRRWEKDPKTGHVKLDPTKTFAAWAYRPSPAQLLRQALGF